MCDKLSCAVLSVRTIIIYLMFIQMVKLKFSCFPEMSEHKMRKVNRRKMKMEFPFPLSFFLMTSHSENFIFLYLTLILLRFFQQHYCNNVTGQSQESEGFCKPARIKEVHSKLHSFQASLCTLAATHLTLISVYTYIRLSVPLGCLIRQAGIIIHKILNMWESQGIEPVTSDLTSVYQISSSTN